MWSARRASVSAALATLAACCLLTSSLLAGEARFVEARGSEHVIVQTADATAEEIIALLAAHFDFAVEPTAAPSQPVRISGRLQGSLDELLERLLRHQAHLIVRSAEARSGISRVVLLEAKGGSPAAGMAGPIAALKAKLQSKEHSEAER